MTRSELVQHIRQKKSYLCVGLDTDPANLPAHLKQRKDGMLEFNKAIIDATKGYAVAYKINTAFYEAQGRKGWEIMEETVRYIPREHFTIADAKRGDIGNTSEQYARAFFDELKFDAITVAPYMGKDSIQPFLEHKNKWTIVLGLTSNPGANDFELQKIETADGSSKCLYEHVIETVAWWGDPEQLMFVAGATQADRLKSLRRKIIPEHFLLVPGVGAQGGSLEDVSAAALTDEIGLLVNASRAIIYASAGEDFAEAAKNVARGYAEEMKSLLNS